VAKERKKERMPYLINNTLGMNSNLDLLLMFFIIFFSNGGGRADSRGRPVHMKTQKNR
jgi:hypothetical protein